LALMWGKDWWKSIFLRQAKEDILVNSHGEKRPNTFSQYGGGEESGELLLYEGGSFHNSSPKP